MGLIHETLIETRYCESDALGHINSVSYFIYIEQARVKFLTESKLTLNPNTDWPFILVSTKCDFKNQLLINEKINIKTTVTHIGKSSFTLKHTLIKQESDIEIANGESVIVYFDFESERSCPLPENMIKKLNLYAEF